MQLDRLLSRIRAALQDYASDFEQRALAAEYAELCARVALRLEQMVPLIRAGQDYAALQIAEASPPVLDLVRQLSFAEAETWRSFCQRRGLPVALPFDEHSVELVNQLYGKKIGETHPLYRDYRQAIRTRQEQAALRVLQSICRVNPDDANARAEYSRLARKLYELKSAELATALDARDATRVLALMASIEADGSVGNDFDPVWQRAVLLRQDRELAAARDRCVALAADLQSLHASGQWEDTLPLLAEWDSLHGQFSFALQPEVETTATAIHSWAAGLLAARRHEEECQRRWQQFASRLDELSLEKPRQLTGKIIASRLDELEDSVAALAADTDSPPSELVARYRARLALLRSVARGRRITRISLTAVTLIVLIGAAVFLSWRTAHERALQAQVGKLKELLQQRAYAPLAETVKTIDTQYPALANDPAVAPVLAQAHAFLSSQQAVRSQFTTELAQLDQAAAGNPSPAQLAALLDSLATLDKSADDLGTESAADLHATVADRRVRWSQALEKAQEQRASQLTAIATQVDQLFAAQIAQSAPAESLQSSLPSVRTVLAQADAIPADTAHASEAEQAARARLAAQVDKLNSLAAAVIDAVDSRAQLANARTLDEYRAPLARLAANPLTGDPTVAAAHALFSHQPDWNTAAQAILLPGDPGVWAFLATLKDSRLQPADDSQKEDIAFSRLVTNDVLGNIYRANLVTYQDGLPHGRTPVFLAGNLTQEDNSWSNNHEVLQTGNLINRDGSTTVHNARLITFGGQTSRGELFTDAQLAPESRLVIRLHQAYDTRSGGIREPLLRVLDDVRADPDASPILKAYLQQELFKIMQNRPDDWGFAFSPSAQADARDLAQLTGGSLQPADWLFPDNPRLADDLKAFYTRTAAHNYYSEASGVLKGLLHLRVTPVLFSGYIDLDQHPRLAVPPPANARLWGLDSSGVWRPLYTFTAGQPVPSADTPDPARLSPLLFTK